LTDPGRVIVFAAVMNGRYDFAAFIVVTVAFKRLIEPLSGSMDVTAHEMTHGVTQETANLNYENQPGALNAVTVNHLVADPGRVIVFAAVMNGRYDFAAFIVVTRCYTGNSQPEL
jgi:hypothetical protein